MGLLDIPAPLYSAIDSLLDFIPLYLRLLTWSLITAVISMALYWLCSAQHKVASAKQRALTARSKMSAYDGAEFGELLPLAKESLAASAQHFLVVLGPAVLSSLPALTLIIWVSNHFSYSLPQAGSIISISGLPADGLAGNAVTDGEQSAYSVIWPAEDNPAPIQSRTGEPLVTLPLAAGVPVLHKRLWWNTLIGNPNGYLPADATLEELQFELPSIEYLHLGPPWLRGWEFSYFALLILASLAIKLVFKIH
jgi:hypothetical protein